LLSLSILNKLSSITPRVSSKKFLTYLAHSLLSNILRSHAFNKMLPWVYSEMESLELLPISFFFCGYNNLLENEPSCPNFFFSEGDVFQYLINELEKVLNSFHFSK